MSFRATLDIDGKTFEILECSSEVVQKSDSRGRPTSGVNGGIITLFLAGTSDDTFANWIMDPTSRKDGTITFFRIDQESKFKEIKFEGAYLTSLDESFITPEENLEELRVIVFYLHNTRDKRKYNRIFEFHSRTSMSYVMHCRLSAEKITIDGVEHDNQW